MSELTNKQLPLAGVTGLLETMSAAEFGGEIRLDKDSGLPIWKLGLVAKFEGMVRRVSIEALLVAAEPPSIELDSEVRLLGATVMLWSRRDGKHGVTIRVRGVELVSAAQPLPVAAPVATEPVERRTAGLPSKPQGGEGK